MDSRGGYVSKILYIKTKESGPFGGVPRARPLDPPMYYNEVLTFKSILMNIMSATAA